VLVDRGERTVTSLLVLDAESLGEVAGGDGLSDGDAASNGSSKGGNGSLGRSCPRGGEGSAESGTTEAVPVERVCVSPVPILAFSFASSRQLGKQKNRKRIDFTDHYVHFE